MTVKELIAELRKQDPEAIVVRPFAYHDGYYGEYQGPPRAKKLEPRAHAFIERCRKDASAQKVVVL